jgi:hypothetical protein
VDRSHPIRTTDEIAKLGGDTLQRLVDGVAAYLAAHPADHPGQCGDREDPVGATRRLTIVRPMVGRIGRPS